MKLSVSKRNQQIQKIDLAGEVLDFDYSETVFLIGRSKECHVVLDDKQISREHSKLIHRNGTWKVELIANESLPLIVNGEEVIATDIHVGDVLNIGQFFISIDELGGEKAPEPLAPQIIHAEPKIQIVEKIIEKIVEVPVEVNKKSDDDATKEIDVSEYTRELSNNNNAEIGEKTSSDVSHSQPASDDFNFDDQPNESFEESHQVDLASEGEVVAEEIPQTEEESAYSLESIDEPSEDSTRVMQTFASVHLELFGETAPYDRYNIDKEKVFIGRDPNKCQIVLHDPEVSSVHAVIVKNNIMMTLEDLNSGNGTILNGNRINKAQLSHNDEFVIGGVTFTVKFRSEFLQEEHGRLMPVDENQSIEVEEVVEVPVEDGETLNAFGEVEAAEPEEKSIIKRILKDEKKRKTALYVVVGIVLAWFMFDEDKPAPKPVINQKKQAKADAQELATKTKGNSKVKLTEEQKRKFAEVFQIGKNHFDNGRYREALEQFDIITAVDPFYNSSLPSLVATAKEGLKRLEEQERKRREEEAQVERKLKIQQLLVEARKYTEDHNAELANETFSKITALDPENYEVGVLKRNLKAWEDEKKRKELEETTKKSDRERKVKQLAPAKTLFVQKNYYQAMNKLTEFLQITPMDEDLTREATDMLKTSKEEISAAVNPLLGKAKSLLEGQDLKGAYEVYTQVLKFEPSNTEALNQTNEIKEQLNIKARKIYREAIISESLSLFQDAKEKLQEVQQISPVDSEYYKKASEKLKDYMD